MGMLHKLSALQVSQTQDARQLVSPCNVLQAGQSALRLLKGWIRLENGPLAENHRHLDSHLRLQLSNGARQLAWAQREC